MLRDQREINWESTRQRYANEFSFAVLVFRTHFEVGGFEINEGKDHHACPVRLVKIRIKRVLESGSACVLRFGVQSI